MSCRRCACLEMADCKGRSWYAVRIIVGYVRANLIRECAGRNACCCMNAIKTRVGKRYGIAGNGGIESAAATGGDGSYAVIVTTGDRIVFYFDFAVRITLTVHSYTGAASAAIQGYRIVVYPSFKVAVRESKYVNDINTFCLDKWIVDDVEF